MARAYATPNCQPNAFIQKHKHKKKANGGISAIGFHTRKKRQKKRQKKSPSALALGLWETVSQVSPSDALDSAVLATLGVESRLVSKEVVDLLRELTELGEAHPLGEKVLECLAHHKGFGHPLVIVTFENAVDRLTDEFELVCAGRLESDEVLHELVQGRLVIDRAILTTNHVRRKADLHDCILRRALRRDCLPSLLVLQVDRWVQPGQKNLYSDAC
ncbi:MAG: hypothetical protein EBT07_09090 [Actinobacteria bacterium]|nr:hypothetical protein [Actinomycetota bacterium]